MDSGAVSPSRRRKSIWRRTRGGMWSRQRRGFLEDARLRVTLVREATRLPAVAIVMATECWPDPSRTASRSVSRRSPWQPPLRCGAQIRGSLPFRGKRWAAVYLPRKDAVSDWEQAAGEMLQQKGSTRSWDGNWDSAQTNDDTAAVGYGGTQSNASGSPTNAKVRRAGRWDSREGDSRCPDQKRHNVQYGRQRSNRAGPGLQKCCRARFVKVSLARGDAHNNRTTGNLALETSASTPPYRQRATPLARIGLPRISAPGWLFFRTRRKMPRLGVRCRMVLKFFSHAGACCSRQANRSGRGKASSRLHPPCVMSHSEAGSPALRVEETE